MQLFSTSLSHPLVITLIVVYAIAAAITTYDIRYIQAKNSGKLSDQHLEPPFWIGFFGYVLWLTWIGLFLLNWMLAIALFVIKFILKVLPVLEVIGEEIIRPFSKPIQHKGSEELTAYEKLVKTLDTVKKGETSTDQKIEISRELIERSPITKEEKTALSDMIGQIYNES